MSERTLVIILGQLRAAEITWENFRINVLSELQADLAVCTPNDSFFDFTNPFYTNAKYRWLVPAADDLSEMFDGIQRLLGGTGDWRILCDIQGNWMGRIKESGRDGPASLLFVLRWFMLDNIRAAGLIDEYDRFVVTRSDFLYYCPHPPLDCLDSKQIWVPDGEDYLGLCDRHLVVSAADLVASCNIINDILLRPHEMRSAMISRLDWNVEQVIAAHLARNGLLPRVRRFPYIMFLVRGDRDPTAWSPGQAHPELKFLVKYDKELKSAESYRFLLRSSDDWRLFFAARRVALHFPVRIKSFFGTLFYVDEETGELRHGNEKDVPANAFLVVGREGTRIMHRVGEVSHGIACSSNGCWSPASPTSISNPEPIATFFDHVTDPPGIGLLTAISQSRRIGLRVDNTYLCAESDGRVTLSRALWNIWEQFTLEADRTKAELLWQ